MPIGAKIEVSTTELNQRHGLKTPKCEHQACFFNQKNIGLLTTARGTLITSLTFYKAVISLMIRIISELLLCSVSCSMSHQKELLIL